MNPKTLKEKSLSLRAEIDTLVATVPAAATMRQALASLMTQAEQGHVHAPMAWRDIPGWYLFTEAGLQQYSDLERAFGEFRIELTGGVSLTLQRLKESMGEEPKYEK